MANAQIEQLKLLVNNDLLTDTIANKDDFHQQTKKLRDTFVTHNTELLNKLEEVLNKKRKRDQCENDPGDDSYHDKNE